MRFPIRSRDLKGQALRRLSCLVKLGSESRQATPTNEGVIFRYLEIQDAGRTSSVPPFEFVQVPKG